jgi:hypothetical protein
VLDPGHMVGLYLAETMLKFATHHIKEAVS